MPLLEREEEEIRRGPPASSLRVHKPYSKQKLEDWLFCGGMNGRAIFGVGPVSIWERCWCNLVGRLSFSCPVEGHVALMWYIYMLTFLSLFVSMNKNSPTFILSAPFVLCSLMLRLSLFFFFVVSRSCKSSIFVALKISSLLYLAEYWCALILFSWQKCQHCFLGNKRRHFRIALCWSLFGSETFLTVVTQIFGLLRVSVAMPAETEFQPANRMNPTRSKTANFVLPKRKFILVRTVLDFFAQVLAKSCGNQTCNDSWLNNHRLALNWHTLFVPVGCGWSWSLNTWRQASKAAMKISLVCGHSGLGVRDSGRSW